VVDGIGTSDVIDGIGTRDVCRNKSDKGADSHGKNWHSTKGKAITATEINLCFSFLNLSKLSLQEK
jgi:hypothetical protein